MGTFARALLEGSSLLVMPLIALVIFVLTFAAITIRTLRMDRSLVGRLEGLPLRDGDSLTGDEETSHAE